MISLSDDSNAVKPRPLEVAEHKGKFGIDFFLQYRREEQGTVQGRGEDHVVCTLWSCYNYGTIATHRLGYRKFRCQVCRRLFNERTGTPFTFLNIPRTLFFSL